MKFLGLILIIIFVYQKSYSQNPTCEDCEDKEFQYIYCDVNQSQPYKQTYICTDDPYGELTNNPNLILSKLNGKLCYEFINNPETIDLGWAGARGEFEVILRKSYDITHPDYYEDVTPIFAFQALTGDPLLENPLDEATKAWNDICPIENNEEDPCCVKVRFVTDEFEFERLYKEYNRDNPTIALSWNGWKNWQTAETGEPAPCEKSCERSEILINASANFRNPVSMENGDMMSETWFFTGEPLPDEDPVTGEDYDDFIYYSLYSVLLHELGHQLGFGHDGGEDSFGNDCGEQDNVMSTNFAGRIINQHQYLTDDDICRYKKIYCCNTTNVEQDFKNQSLIYPNPAGEFVFIETDQKWEIIEIFDINGSIVKTKVEKQDNGLIKLNTSDLIRGVYFVKLSNLKRTEIKRIIISK